MIRIAPSVALVTALNVTPAASEAARLDCKRGRADRGLRSYADAEATLRRLEETATAGPPPPERDAASGDIATR